MNKWWRIRVALEFFEDFSK